MPCLSEDTILRFITDEVTAEQAQEIKDHISRCQECRNLLQDYENLNALMGQRSLPNAPKSLSGIILKRLNKLQPVKPAILIYNPWIRKIAGLAFILFIFFTGIQTGNRISIHKMREKATASLLNPSIDSYLVSTQALLLDYTNLNTNSLSIDEQKDLTIRTAKQILEKTKVIKSLINDDNIELVTLITEIERLLEEMILSEETDSMDLENLVRQELVNHQILLRISRFTS